MTSRSSYVQFVILSKGNLKRKSADSHNADKPNLDKKN